MDGRDAHLGHADLLRENDVAACGIRGGSGSGSTSGLGRGEAGGAGDRWARGGTAGHAPRGPRVTATASASLSMPSWILMRDFMSKVRSLASARTLMAKRRGAATRETRADTLEPWMACDGSGWKRRNQPPHFFFREPPVARERAQANDDVSSRDSRDVEDVFTLTPKVARRVARKRALGSSSEERFPRSRSRFEATRSTIVPGKATRRFHIAVASRAGERRVPCARRGRACMTPCMLLRLVLDR